MLPYSAAVTQQIGQAISALAASELFTDAQRRTLSVLCDTVDPVARAAGRRVRPGRVLGAGRLTPRRSARRSSSPCCGSGAPRRADRGPSPAARFAGRGGHGARDAAGSARADRPRVRRLGPEGLAGIVSLRGSDDEPVTTGCPTSGRAAIRTGTRSATRAPARPPSTSRSRFGSGAPLPRRR